VAVWVLCRVNPRVISVGQNGNGTGFPLSTSVTNTTTVRLIVWIDLAHDRDRWPAVVNTVMNLRVP